MQFDSVQAADHWILRSGRPAAHTYFGGGMVHVGFDNPPEGARAVAFTGAAKLVGVLAVSWVLRESAIDSITVLGGPEPQPGQLLDTRDFVRPVWRSAHWTLITQPARGGVLVPFEPEHPLPCCTDHSLKAR